MEPICTITSLEKVVAHLNGEAKGSSSQPLLQMPLLVMVVHKYVHNSLQTQQCLLHHEPLPSLPSGKFNIMVMLNTGVDIILLPRRLWITVARKT